VKAKKKKKKLGKGIDEYDYAVSGALIKCSKTLIPLLSWVVVSCSFFV
jgi:hypothetical protein